MLEKACNQRNNLIHTKTKVLILFVFEERAHYAALDGLELSKQTRLALNSQGSTCLCLPSAGIKDVSKHCAPTPGSDWLAAACWN